MPTSIRRLWWLLAGAHSVVAAWTVYTLLFLPGRIGRVGFFAVVLAVGVIGVALVPGVLNRLRVRVSLWLVAGGWALLCFGLGLVYKDLWLYAVICLLTGATGALVIYTLTEAHPVAWRWVWMVLIAAAAGVYVVRAWGLSVYPLMEMTDEPWLLSYAVAYEKTGELYSDLTSLPLVNAITPAVIHIPLWGWLRLTQFGLWEGRLFFLLFSVPVVFFTANAAKNVGGDIAGVIVFLAMLASMLLAQAARIRPDIHYALILSLSLWLYTIAVQKQNLLWHMVAGVVAGAGIFVHYNAAPLGLVLLISLYIPLLWQSPRQTWRFAVAFMVGGGMVAVFAFAVFVLPRLSDVISSISGRPSTGLDGVLYSLRGHIRNVYGHSQLEFLLIVAGVGAALLRRRSFDLSLVMLLILSHAALGFVAKEPFMQYVRQLVPIYGLLVGLMLARMPTVVEGDMRALSAGVLLPLMLLGTTLAAPLRHIVEGGGVQPPTPEAVQWIEDHVAPYETLLGSHYYYLWLNDYDYASTYIPNVLTNNFGAGNVDAAQIWREIDADVIIWDFESPGWMRPDSVMDYIEANDFVAVATFENAVIYSRE